MKLIYRIALRLSLVLLPLLALWAVLFYAAMVDEINDEADDALEDYSGADRHADAGRSHAALTEQRFEQQLFDRSGRRGLCFGTPPHRLL